MEIKGIVKKVSLALSVALLLSISLSAYAETGKELTENRALAYANISPETNDLLVRKINDYATYVNNKSLDNYIELFDSETQAWMKECAKQGNFFLGEKVTICRVKALSEETGRKVAFIEPDEFGSKPIIVYYVEAICDTSEVTSENIKPLNGDIFYAFVFVCEGDEWKIGRVSIADSSKAVEGGEGYRDSKERKMISKEKKALLKASLSEPSTICIKMTKSANKKYWGKDYVTLGFKDYILNVVPNEFYVSKGGEYLKAGTMVVKMFGWYHVIHKKYPNSPGGCDLQDTSNDQNYLVNSYANLGTYKSTMDTAYDAIDGLALVDNSETIFETQYIAGNTDSSTGKLGAKTAASLASNGEKYDAILKDAYDYSTNANGKKVKIISY